MYIVGARIIVLPDKAPLLRINSFQLLRIVLKALRYLTTDVDCNNSTTKTTCLSNIESFGIESVIIHENFETPTSFSNDIALIKLKSKVDVKEHNSPICLPVNAALEKEATSRETLLHTGWGYNNWGLSNVKLHEVIVNNNVANQTCGPLIPVKSENHICFSASSETLCRGTSGNPLSGLVDYSGMKRFVQFAIVSFGYRNCNPSVGINVARFMPWITNVLAEES
ncbi:serine protease grass-like [Drosophila grimshawi]|nr:serine protease grass-like [Drosophila grimshawi]